MPSPRGEGVARLETDHSPHERSSPKAPTGGLTKLVPSIRVCPIDLFFRQATAFLLSKIK